MKTRELSFCFLFAKHLDADGCVSIRLNHAGELEAPLMKRTPAEILTLQENAKTIVVLPSTLSSIHLLTLPWLGGRKAREAIPFALEEVIAQSVTEVHFAFDKTFYKNGQYLVVAIDNHILADCVGLLDELDIDFDVLTLDWFALKQDEVLVSERSVLISSQAFKGTLSPELAKLYLEEAGTALHGFLFDDSSPGVKWPHLVSLEGSFDSFVAKRLVSGEYMNLCQGDFKHNTHREANTRWYHASTVLLGLWLVSILGMDALVLNKLKVEDAQLQQKIAVVYHDFFPQATEVISPKFRIEQALQNDATGNKGDLWYLLGPLVKAVDDTDSIKISEWWYLNKMMTVHITAKDFSKLEAFENRLKNAKIDVKQASAGTGENNEVNAFLELRV